MLRGAPFKHMDPENSTLTAFFTYYNNILSPLMRGKMSETLISASKLCQFS